MYELLAIFAVFTLFYSVIAGGLAKTPISSAMVYTSFGLLAGPLVFDWLDINVEVEGLRSIAEITLAVVLFTDAANADLRVLRRSAIIPQRLLLIGLPLTIAFGYLTGSWVLPELGFFELAILATMLAPTDAALGAAVVADKAVPANIRQGLNVESGLNDGICVPVLLLFLALAIETETKLTTTEFALHLFLAEIGIGAGVGLLAAIGASWLLKACVNRGWVNDTWRQLPVIALAIACFSIAAYFEGSGFIASFTGGIVFGGLAKSHKEDLLLAAEGTGELLGLITWTVFGAAVVGQSFELFSWSALVYALLSLTVIRMLPVLLVLTGTGLTFPEKLFVSWFGPRGLASIVFGVMVLNAQLPNESIIGPTVMLTITLSILLHGLTANPLINLLFRKTGRMASDQSEI